MKRVPCCSVCGTRYDEEEHTPLLLHCGHGFCRACLSKMFASTPDSTLSCPRCRHPTAIGNSVNTLKKNFSIISLISSSNSSPSFDFEVNSDAGSEADEDDFFESRARSTSGPSVSGCCCSRSCSHLDLSSHQELNLVRRLGDERNAGCEVWSAVLCRGTGSAGRGSVVQKCRHQVAVKRFVVTEEMAVDQVHDELDRLRRASIWCRNVCVYHGVMKIDSHLCLVMDRYTGSIQDEMQQNNGRLTLEQILRSQII